MVQSIEKEEFVEFTSLLPESASCEEEPFTEVTEKVVLLTYAAVRGKKHPEDIPELMAYAATTIVKRARDYGDQNWLAYDYRFRQLAAAKTDETVLGSEGHGSMVSHLPQTQNNSTASSE